MTLKRRDFITKAAGGAVGAVAVGACGAPEAGVDAAGGTEMPRVSWRLASSYPPNLDLLHGAAERIARRVSELTGGRFTIHSYAANELVPALQVMDAVQQGTVHCGLSAGYFYIGKHPALGFDTAIPFGLNPRQQIAWLYHGGGLERLNEIYATFGIVAFPALATPGQMGGWFREPVDSLADLRGLRMRIPGIGGEVMARLGVTVQVLAAGEIYPALERGAIDAAEWVGPYDDEKLGFHEIAKYYYYPGWWEPGVTVPVMVNREAYEALPETYRNVLATVCGETLVERLAVYDAAEPAALRRLVEDHGVIVREYPQEILDAAWRESNAYLQEQAAADPAFRAVYDSWRAFRDLVFPYSGLNELSYQNAAFHRVGATRG